MFTPSRILVYLNRKKMCLPPVRWRIMTGAKTAKVENKVEMRSSRVPNHLTDDRNINMDSAW